MDANVRSVKHVSDEALIQAEQKTELPPQIKSQGRSTASVRRCVADTVEVQRRRGPLATGVTPLRSLYGRSKLVRRNRRGRVGRSGQPQSMIGGDGRKRLWRQRTSLGVDLGDGWWGSSRAVSGDRVTVPGFPGPIPKGRWFLALQLSRLSIQVIASTRRQLGLHVFRVQRVSPDRWFGCFSGSCVCRVDDRRGIMHRGEMKTFVRPVRWLVRRLRNLVESGHRLNGIIKW